VQGTGHAPRRPDKAHATSHAPTATTQGKGGRPRPHCGQTWPRGPATFYGGHQGPRLPATHPRQLDGSQGTSTAPTATNRGAGGAATTHGIQTGPKDWPCHTAATQDPGYRTRPHRSQTNQKEPATPPTRPPVAQGPATPPQRKDETQGTGHTPTTATWGPGDRPCPHGGHWNPEVRTRPCGSRPGPRKPGTHSRRPLGAQATGHDSTTGTRYQGDRPRPTAARRSEGDRPCSHAARSPGDQPRPHCSQPGPKGPAMLPRRPRESQGTGHTPTAARRVPGDWSRPTAARRDPGNRQRTHIGHPGTRKPARPHGSHQGRGDRPPPKAAGWCPATGHAPTAAVQGPGNRSLLHGDQTKLRQPPCIHGVQTGPRKPATPPRLSHRSQATGYVPTAARRVSGDRRLPHGVHTPGAQAIRHARQRPNGPRGPDTPPRWQTVPRETATPLRQPDQDQETGHSPTASRWDPGEWPCPHGGHTSTRGPATPYDGHRGFRGPATAPGQPDGSLGIGHTHTAARGDQECAIPHGGHLEPRGFTTPLQRPDKANRTGYAPTTAIWGPGDWPHTHGSHPKPITPATPQQQPDRAQGTGHAPTAATRCLGDRASLHNCHRGTGNRPRPNGIHLGSRGPSTPPRQPPEAQGSCHTPRQPDGAQETSMP